MDEKKYQAALKLAVTMKKRHPDNDEAKFYEAWLGAFTGDLDHIKTLLKFSQKKPTHPQVDFAIAPVYDRQGGSGSEQKVKKYAKRMLKKDSRHAGARALLEKK